MALLYRAARNPVKYFRRSFWRTIRHVTIFQIRPRVFFGPAQWLRRLRGERPIRMYVFPAHMDKYQFAELYVAWKVLRFCNVEIVDTPERAEIALLWEPATQFFPDDSLLQSLQRRMRVINGRCTDIRKSNVDRIFEETFGYSIEVDPQAYHGTLIRKSEKNGAHDALLLEAPVTPQDGYVYQRLLTPVALEKGYPDYRTFIVGGEVVAVNRNFHPLDERFRPLASAAELMNVNEAFTTDELRAIRAFNERMGLEFGVLDIIRDRDDGRVYILDCNNTATGPTRKLPVGRQIGLMRTVSQAFESVYLCELRATRSSKADVQPSPVEETLSKR